MFHLVQELLPFVFALFLLDTLTHVDSGHQLYLSHTAGGRFRRKIAGFRWLGLRPDARAFSTHRLAAVLTPGGVFLPRTKVFHGVSCFHPESFRFLKYEELAEIEIEHKTVRPRRGLAVRMPSPTHAADLAERLRELRELSAEQRAKRLQAWRRRADLKALRRRLGVVRDFRRPLEWLCLTLSFLTFAGLPATLYLTSSAPLLVAVLLTLAAGHVLVLVEAVGLLRRLRRQGIARIRGVLTPLFLSPPAALRAPVTLTRDTFPGYDDLTMAAALLPRAELLALARRELHGADYALTSGSEPEWSWFWQDRRDHLVDLLGEVGVSEGEALAAPARCDADSERYCPLCLGEYRSGVESCEDCGLPLLSFGRV